MKPDYASLELPPAPSDRPYVLLNMVMSADGKAVFEGSERGLGSPVDQRLMRELRTNADLVLGGASTLRATGSSPYLGDPALEALRLARGRSRFPRVAVLSRSGDLPLQRLFFRAADFEAIVYLAGEVPAGRQAAIVATGRRVVELPAEGTLPAMLSHMRQVLDVRVLLLEGGPTTNAAFFAEGLIDEYFLTLGAVIVGGRGQVTAVEGERPFAPTTAPRLDLVSACPDTETGEVFLRYRVKRWGRVPAGRLLVSAGTDATVAP